MDFELTDIQQAVRETARGFAEKRVARVARDNDRAGRFPADLIQEMGGLGLLAINVPEPYGGAEAGAVAYSLAMMEIAAADCSTAVTMAVTNMVGEIISRFGSEEQKRRHCPKLASAEYQAGAFALSEPQAGSDAGALTAKAVRRGDRYLLNGTKQWITNGAQAGVLVVMARTEESAGTRGITAFLVEKDAPGMTVGKHEDKLGLRASNTVSITFEDCELPVAAVLGAPGDGFRIAMGALDGGRIGIASQATGTIRASLEASVRYAKDRKAFGEPLAQFQAIQWMLSDMQTEHDAARLLTLRAAALKEADRPYTREASMAKLFASEASQRAVSHAVQIHGGYGYIDEFPVERYFRDARVQTIYEGTSEIQRLVIARDLLK
jgi:alkylation response protein AidB-like acyl-CoA dehydrogenase